MVSGAGACAVSGSETGAETGAEAGKARRTPPLTPESHVLGREVQVSVYFLRHVSGSGKYSGTGKIYVYENCTGIYSGSIYAT